MRKNIQGGKRRTLLGIELPFGWCLVRGAELRRLQSELREARFDAGLRSRMCGHFLKELYRKESP